MLLGYPTKFVCTNMPYSIKTAHWTSRVVLLTGPAVTPRVLVVDDYEVGAEALALALSFSGYDVRYAFSGASALAITSQWTPDIAVLDISMPDQDGFEVAKLLREQAPMRNIAIIAFTALDESYVRIRAMSAGIDGYCQKGGVMGSLLEMIDRMLAGCAADPVG